MMIRELLLGIMFFIWVKGASGNSVLQVQNTTIKRNVGGRVTLPCSVGNNTNITLQRIEWFKGEKTSENNQPIHKCIWRPNATETQREDFKNLTCLFVEELPSGNVSLSLRLKASHNDTYYCYVGGHLYCIVTIIVLPAGEDDSSQIHQDDHVSPDKANNDTDGQTQNNWIICCIVGAVGAVVAVGVAAALISLVVYRRCKHRNPQNEPVDQNPNEEQIPLDEV